MSNQNPGNVAGTPKNAETGAEQTLNTAVEKLNKNKNIILYSVIGILVIVAAVLAYLNLYLKPHQKAADEALYKAESYFAKDSFLLALEGNGADIVGFNDIIKKYGSTKAGNLAEYYAGVSLYHLGRYEEAISHLKKFKSKDIMVAPAAKGLIGDALVELGKTEEAVGYFENAAKMADNDLISPIYLQKAGIAYRSLGKKEEALKAFETIKTKYAGSALAPEADKYIQELRLLAD